MNSPEVSKTVLDTHFVVFDFYCFTFGPHEEDNVLCEVNPGFKGSPLVRIQSACYTAEIFRSRDCDCHEQLETSLRRISQEGGVLIYMLCDGRGAGLQHKVRGLELGRTHGLDTADAYQAMGLALDPREYQRAALVLSHFGITSIRLLTNNPRKVSGLSEYGINVIREPLEIPATDASRPYLKAKKIKLGHALSQVDE
jgi:GTP cyclohydrolase II